MKKFVFIFMAILLVAGLAGCKKKELGMEVGQEGVTMEALNAPATTPPTEVKLPVPPALPESVAKLSESLPPTGPFKPSAKDIQTALKNAGMYTGPIDGRIGPLTTAAITAFQKANGLQADGKVGTKTWAALGRYLTAVTTKPVQ